MQDVALFSSAQTEIGMVSAVSALANNGAPKKDNRTISAWIKPFGTILHVGAKPAILLLRLLVNDSPIIFLILMKTALYGYAINSKIVPLNTSATEKY